MLVSKTDHDQAFVGRSVRVLAFGLAFVFLASRMTTREREGGKSFGGCARELWGGGVRGRERQI